MESGLSILFTPQREEDIMCNNLHTTLVGGDTCRDSAMISERFFPLCVLGAPHSKQTCLIHKNGVKNQQNA